VLAAIPALGRLFDVLILKPPDIVADCEGMQHPIFILDKIDDFVPRHAYSG
jgi:hypothetical protein